MDYLFEKNPNNRPKQGRKKHPSSLTSKLKTQISNTASEMSLGEEMIFAIAVYKN
jgi:hypothetical protein